MKKRDKVNKRLQLRRLAIRQLDVEETQKVVGGKAGCSATSLVQWPPE